MSYQIEGPLPLDFRVGVYLDGVALDVTGESGVMETPFRTPFRTFNVRFDTGPHVLMLEVVAGAGHDDGEEEDYRSILSVATVSFESVTTFCSVCCPLLPPRSLPYVHRHPLRASGSRGASVRGSWDDGGENEIGGEKGGGGGEGEGEILRTEHGGGKEGGRVEKFEVGVSGEEEGAGEVDETAEVLVVTVVFNQVEMLSYQVCVVEYVCSKICVCSKV